MSVRYITIEGVPREVLLATYINDLPIRGIQSLRERIYLNNGGKEGLHLKVDGDRCLLGPAYFSSCGRSFSTTMGGPDYDASRVAHVPFSSNMILKTKEEAKSDEQENERLPPNFDINRWNAAQGSLPRLQRGPVFRAQSIFESPEQPPQVAVSSSELQQQREDISREAIEQLYREQQRHLEASAREAVQTGYSRATVSPGDTITYRSPFVNPTTGQQLTYDEWRARQAEYRANMSARVRPTGR